MQWHLDADHFLYPQQLLDMGYVTCPLLTWSSAMSWNKESLSPAWLILRHSEGHASKEVQLTLPYSIDEGLGVCHLTDLCISHKTKAFDAQHDPVTGCAFYWNTVHLSYEKFSWIFKTKSCNKSVMFLFVFTVSELLYTLFVFHRPLSYKKGKLGWKFKTLYKSFVLFELQN